MYLKYISQFDLNYHGNSELVTLLFIKCVLIIYKIMQVIIYKSDLSTH